MEKEFDDPAELMDIVVGYSNGKAVYLRDVARVEDTIQEKYQEAYINGKPGAQIIIQKQTDANVPVIINKGSKWFRSIGTEGSAGTKAFSLAGNIRNTGLIEVPMGTTLKKIVFDIGGGVKTGKFKSVQVGGKSVRAVLRPYETAGRFHMAL